VLQIIGENFNTTRRIKPTSPRVVHDAGKVGISYSGPDASRRLLDVTSIYPTDPAKLRVFQIPHVAHAVRTKDVDYIAWLIRSQTSAGANIIDLCIDEIDVNPEVRHRTMAWLVPIAQKITDAVIAIDSSDPETIMTGLRAHDGSRSRPAINSVNLEEGRDLIKEARSRNALLFANASGATPCPRTSMRRRELEQLMR
jgi:hypothetical protein